MALSTTFTQCAPETAKLSKIMQNGLFRHSRSFKVTDIGTNRKLIYDFGLPIKTIAKQVLRINSWIYESATNLYHGRRAVPLQTFTTRHSNREFSIVMALSTTFRQSTPETTKFSKITQNKGHFAVQGHSRSTILVQIESSYTTSSISDYY